MMYYILLPSEEHLETLIRTNIIHKKYDMTCFITTDEGLAILVRNFFNSFSVNIPNSIVYTMMLCDKNVPILFQIQELPHDLIQEWIQQINYPRKKFNNTDDYPYNFICPEGVINMEQSRREHQTYNDTHFDANEIRQVREYFGPNII